MAEQAATMISMLPWLLTMGILMILSAFFSASEAALFSLPWQQRSRLDEGSPGQRASAALLARPDRLLTAVLFWNLVVNMCYFAITAHVGLLIQEDPGMGSSTMVLFSVASLLAIIFFSEMLPKSLAVLRPAWLASLVGIPLVLFVRLTDPLIPLLHFFQLVTRRLLWPHFKVEPALDVADMDRAVNLSTEDAQLAEREKRTLHHIIELSEIRVDEWMRPRRQFLSFHPPVSLSDLDGQVPPSGYLLVTEPDSEEIQSAIPLKRITGIPSKHLEHHGTPVLHVPWVATVADTLQKMQDRQREVAAVVNEFGETIGVLTMEDILDTLFRDESSRSGLLDRTAIEEVTPGCWYVMGMTSIRRLARHFDVELP
ncbi:MAG: CNNM domain-containing protein, partial [Pirellulaceae bacterium]